VNFWPLEPFGSLNSLGDDPLIFLDNGGLARVIQWAIMRIGLISDTHIPQNAEELPQYLKYIFSGMDLILHGGDVCKSSVLDELSAIAPVLAARGDADVGSIANDDRVKEKHILSIEGLTLWLIHTYRSDDWSTYEMKGKDFWHQSDPPPDVLVHGHTHQAAIARRGSMLRITPGSATFPKNETALGTLGFLTLESGEAEARIIEL
jgi:putative phosphoesterase